MTMIRTVKIGEAFFSYYIDNPLIYGIGPTYCESVNNLIVITKASEEIEAEFAVEDLLEELNIEVKSDERS
jgi:hypothetical protein